MPGILILAAGEGDRWAKDPKWTAEYPKQLAPVGPHTVIERQLRQIAKFKWDHPVYLVVRDRSIEGEFLRVAHALQTIRAGIVVPKHERSIFIVREMAEAKDYWFQDWTIVLLGDVVYSEEVMRGLLNGRPEQLEFWRNGGEIFALKFPWLEHKQLLNKLRRVAVRAEKSMAEETPFPGQGRLWTLYRAWNGVALGEHKLFDGPADKVITDYTQDLDLPRDYEKLLRDVVKTGELEIP